MSRSGSRVKCKHCHKFIYRNVRDSRSTGGPWRHAETGSTECTDAGGRPHPVNRAKPEGA